jgi:hypothetical protein
MRYPKYDEKTGCVNCPVVEECTDDAGYTSRDEYGECPGNLIQGVPDESSQKDTAQIRRKS